MSEMLTVMKWPSLACLLLPGMLVYLGLHIVRREVIFVDLALAQVAALGTCVCLMLGHEAKEAHTFFWSFGFTLIGAAIFALTRAKEHHRVPQEALIGIVYVVAVCANFLTARLGALLAIGWTTATVASVVGLYLAYRFDFPTGAAIVCVLGAALVLAGIVARFRKTGGSA